MCREIKQSETTTYSCVSCLRLARLSVLEFSRGHGGVAWVWIGPTGFVLFWAILMKSGAV